ncbi:nucleotidyltransferase [bacterium]|nr:nucleotidyltransferase [bacterium]
MTKELKSHLATISENLPSLEKTFFVKKIGIFGSVSRGDQTKKSDIDIIVEFSQPVGFFKFLELEYFLSKILKKKVDLATKKALKPAIKKDVLKEAIYV